MAVKRIELTNGNHALVDEDLYEFLNKWNWIESSFGYAIRFETIPNSGSKQKRIWMHRVIVDTPEHLITDHINGNKLDNRKENLRIVTHTENGANRKKKYNSKSKYKGVSLCSNPNRKKKWRARITVNGKLKFLGNFYTEDEAAKAYNDAALKHFGEYARLNDV